MPDNILKIARRNTFTFDGHVVRTDNSFIINKTNEKGTWVFNSLNVGIDCGDHGVNYINLMGGYNPQGGSYITIQKIGEDGKLLPKEDNIKVDWEDRLDFDIEAEDINKSSFIKISIEKDSNDKTISRTFITPYDAIDYLNTHLVDKLPVSVRGHIDYRLNDAGDWIPSHIVDSISIRKEEFLQPKTVLDLMVLIDKDTLGKPNLEDKNVPLYVKTLFYVYKVNNSIYKQVCAIPMKILFDINAINLDDEKDREKFSYGVKHFFSPETDKKNYTSEILFRCHYSGGVKKVEVKLEDLPKDIQDGIKYGFMDKDQVMSGYAIQGPQTREIIFDNVPTIMRTIEADDGTVGTRPEIVAEFSKYKNSEILLFDDLEPVEEINKPTAPVDTTLNISDEEIDSDADSILKMFSALGN